MNTYDRLLVIRDEINRRIHQYDNAVNTLRRQAKEHSISLDSYLNIRDYLAARHEEHISDYSTVDTLLSIEAYENGFGPCPTVLEVYGGDEVHEAYEYLDKKYIA
jgi:hypothetical protein